MNTHLHKSVLIDLFNLPPLANECNTEESYMDVPHNYYVPDGKNSRLLDLLSEKVLSRGQVPLS